MKKILLKIITPERVVFEEHVYQITLPLAGGEITMLPDHIPFIGVLKIGEIKVRKEKNGEVSSLSTSGGFLEFHDNILTLLADTAERAEEIDMQKAKDAVERAEMLMKNTPQDTTDAYLRTAALLEKERMRIHVARKHHSRSGQYFEQ
jgi:F-type H+-transporting ATPase subunit epsilon